MSNYAIELINVSTPTGDAIFLTNRTDRRTDSSLAREVPGYFKDPNYTFINKVVLADNLSKDAGELALKKFYAVYESLNVRILNVPTAKGRKEFELFQTA